MAKYSCNLSGRTFQFSAPRTAPPWTARQWSLSTTNTTSLPDTTVARWYHGQRQMLSPQSHAGTTDSARAWNCSGCWQPERGGLYSTYSPTMRANPDVCGHCISLSLGWKYSSLWITLPWSQKEQLSIPKISFIKIPSFVRYTFLL